MDFIQLRTFDNYIEANIVMNMLRSSSINCHLKDENIITIDPLLSPALGGMKLMVHHSQVERAWDLMEKAEHEYLKSIPCPVCKSHALIKEVITKKHRCKLGALASMLLNGQSVEVTQIYRCTNCGYDFKELP
jgi:DNA-directed RNA polymerase subunit RPC12/RpoP